MYKICFVVLSGYFLFWSKLHIWEINGLKTNFVVVWLKVIYHKSTHIIHLAHLISPGSASSSSPQVGSLGRQMMTNPVPCRGATASWNKVGINLQADDQYFFPRTYQTKSLLLHEQSSLPRCWVMSPSPIIPLSWRPYLSSLPWPHEALNSVQESAKWPTAHPLVRTGLLVFWVEVSQWRFRHPITFWIQCIWELLLRRLLNHLNNIINYQYSGVRMAEVK